MRSLKQLGQDTKWAITSMLNMDVGTIALKWKIVTGIVSCGIWALATFIFGKVVMV